MTQYFAPAPPRVLAHRGLAVDAPENTMLAFAAAVAAGAEYVETDVHASADGLAVIAHDPNLDRVAGRDIRIEHTLWHELASLDLGQEQRVPQLRDALLAFPDTRWNIDMKSDAAVVPTVRAIVEAHATERVLLTSFSERRRRRAKHLLPDVATSASQAIMVRALAAHRAGMRRTLARVLGDVQAVQVPRSHRGIAIVTRRSVEAFHRAGVEVHVWTINDPVQMRELVRLGVDGIVTDRCDVALTTLR